MQIKKLFYSLIIVFILAISFFLGYSLSFNGSIYADSEGWENCSSLEDQAKAFRAYCKSRDLTIEGSVADAVTTFTSDTYRKIVDKLGLNIDAIGSQVKKAYDSSNGGTKYLFTSQGAGFYSQIFSQFLYDNDLDVGDSADQNNNLVFSGELFTDLNGYSALVWIISSNGGQSTNANVTAQGSYYRFTNESILSIGENNDQNYYYEKLEFTSDKYVDYYVRFNRSIDWGLYNVYPTTSTSSTSVYGYYKYLIQSQNINFTGYPIIYRTSTTDTRYYLGQFTTNNSNGVNYNVRFGNFYFTLPSNSEQIQPTIIFLTTNNNTINNNNYGGNTYTEINNNGDVYNYDTDDPPSVNPGGGGGDSTIIDFPNLDFNIPNLDWSLGDLSQKFPFSIPFDLVAFYTVLNADPVAPAIDRNIPLGNWYTWRFQADFSQFDDYAVIIRNVEYIGFVVGLIYLTIRFVKG